ncbi:MAG: hypothetical protein ACXWQZ_13725, partial [Ktedonobacterales bacterium]
VLRELDIFERLMADSGPGSWREGAKAISLALVDLTERIHSAISLRLQQTQAIAALLRRSRDLAEGGEEATQRARQYLWNASGAMHAAVWVQGHPSSDDQVRLDRWLEMRGGSPLPLVDEEIWQKSLRPRHRPAPPPPPQALLTSEDWNPGEDPRIREMEEARAWLVERLIAAGSAAALGALESFDELRLLASFLWLPRDSAPLRRLGLRIQPPGAGMARRVMLRGPEFEVELDNYRFTATTASRQAQADATRAAREAKEAVERLSAIASGEIEQPRRPAVAAAVSVGAATPPSLTPFTPGTTHPLEDIDPLMTRPLPAIEVPAASPTRPLQSPAYPAASVAPAAPLPGARPAPAAPTPAPQPQPAPTAGGRRFWPFARRNGDSRQAGS